MNAPQHEPMICPITGFFLKMIRIIQEDHRERRWTGKRNKSSKPTIGKARKKP